MLSPEAFDGGRWENEIHQICEAVRFLACFRYCAQKGEFYGRKKDSDPWAMPETEEKKTEGGGDAWDATQWHEVKKGKRSGKLPSNTTATTALYTQKSSKPIVTFSKTRTGSISARSFAFREDQTS